jgi:hypothetical protein
VWEKSSLSQALEQFLSRLGPRIKLHREETAPRRDLISWCCEQSLKHGLSLPPGLSTDEHSVMVEVMQPQWIGESSLQRLEHMGLSDDGIERVLKMMIDGTIDPPKTRPTSGPSAAAMDLMDPLKTADAPELASLIASLYEQNERLMRVRRKLWLSRLDQLAEQRLTRPPENLHHLLKDHIESQWIVVDCLGLPLHQVAQQAIKERLRHWMLSRIDFGEVQPSTTTDSFYRSLIGADIDKAFHKIDAIDALIHGRKLTYNELAKLAQAELELAFKKAEGKLDRTRPVLIFGDHGFRLAADGRGFTHGGSSTLERITPMYYLNPLAG